MEQRNFFAELKRRNVYKVAVAYAVVGWLAIQVCATIVPALHMPEGITTAVVVLVLLGFPIALVIAWAFEMTPEGMKRTEDVSPGANLPQWSRRKFVALLAVTALLAAGLLAWQLFRGGTRSVASSAADKPTNATERVPSDQSIAVLPFENLSDDKQNAFFASGIQDEILTRLAKINSLKVISRTSTQQYQSKPASVGDIGKQLGVAHILEGSVQKIGNAVHINVQLIHTATDQHLWAESYNRTLDDVFAVEAEIAAAIAEQLNATLSGSEQKALGDRLTKNPAAYEAYLRGVSLDLSFVSIPRLQQAAREYEEAVRFDPNFGIAWAKIARARGTLLYFGIELNTNTAATVRDAADRAMALAPDAGETWLALGTSRAVGGDPVGAVTAYQEAQKRMPNNALIYLTLGFGQRRVGRWREAEGNLAKAVELDPRNVQVLLGTSEYYGALRRHDQALTLTDRAIAIAPEFESSRASKAARLRKAGKLKEAGEELKRIPADSTDRSVLESRADQALYEGQPADASAIASVVSAFPREQRNARERSVLVACAYCLLNAGRIDEARNIFRQVLDEELAAAEPDLNVLAMAHAGLGEKEKAIDAAQRRIATAGDLALGKTDAEITLAVIETRFGDKEAALAALPHLLEVPYGLTLADLRFDPSWDSLRADPRFQKLLTSPEHVGP